MFCFTQVFCRCKQVLFFCRKEHNHFLNQNHFFCGLQKKGMAPVSFNPFYCIKVNCSLFSLLAKNNLYSMVINHLTVVVPTLFWPAASLTYWAIVHSTPLGLQSYSLNRVAGLLLGFHSCPGCFVKLTAWDDWYYRVWRGRDWSSQLTKRNAPLSLTEVWSAEIKQMQHLSSH